MSQIGIHVIEMWLTIDWSLGIVYFFISSNQKL